MTIELLKKLRTSVALTGLLAGVLTLGACQQQSDTEAGIDDGAHSEETVPMSAEPAEPNEVVEVQDDTVASVNSGVSQIAYLCSPELKVNATYKEDAKQVVIATDTGTVTLNKTNDASNPEVFEVATAIDGSQGFTQWRVAHEARETGVMRTAGTDAANVSTYECKKTS